jgi:hypothetical protein
LENREKARFLAKDDNLKTKAETDIALHHGKLVAGAGFELATKQVALSILVVSQTPQPSPLECLCACQSMFHTFGNPFDGL